MQLDVWFDPGCPWTWNTARWLMAVADARAAVAITWRPFSLDVKNAEVDLPPPIRDGVQASRRALRMMERARLTEGDDAVPRLYVEYGRRFHHDGDRQPDLAEIAAAVGLDRALADAADDTGLDGGIVSSMREALELAGDDAGVPVMAFRSIDGQPGFFGPILTSVPVGDEALQLFDDVAALATHPQLTELKRARRSGPELPPRP